MLQALIVVLLTCSSHSQLIIQWQDSVGNYTTADLTFSLNYQQKDPITASLVTINQPNIAGNILVAIRPIPGNVQKSLQILQAKLPAAVVLVAFDSTPGADEFLLDCWECASQIVVPFASINNINGTFLLSQLENGLTPNATLYFGPNSYRIAKSAALWTAGQIIVAAMAVTGMILCLWRFIEFQQATGFKLSIAQVSLLILLLAATITAINYIPDPWFTRKIYPYAFFVFFMTTPPPLVDVVCIMITLYWFELVVLTKLQVSSFLSRAVIPFMVLASVLLALEFIVAAVRTFIGATFAIQAVQIIYTFIVLAVMLIFYIITAVGVLKKLKAFADKSKDATQLRKTAIIMTFSAAGLALRVVSPILAIAATGPSNFLTLSWLVNFSSMWLVITLSLSFIPQHTSYKKQASTYSSSGRSLTRD